MLYVDPVSLLSLHHARAAECHAESRATRLRATGRPSSFAGLARLAEFAGLARLVGPAAPAITRFRQRLGASAPSPAGCVCTAGACCVA